MLRTYQRNSADKTIEYFENELQHDDYYSEGHTVAGEWGGKMAGRLGLSGNVQADDFKSIVRNRKPNDEKLTQRDAHNRITSFDFNFNVPKSISIARMLTGDTAIDECMNSALQKTMELVESHAQTRVRTGQHANSETTRTTGNLLWAKFLHKTTRPVNGTVDPNMHFHCLVMNATHDPVEDKIKAVNFRNLKSNAPLYEATFHSHLAAALRAQGYHIEKQEKFYDLAGMDRGMIDKFSNRSQQIDEAAREQGITSVAAKAKLGAITREDKADVPNWQRLLQEWKDRLTPAELQQLDTLKDEKNKQEYLSAEEALTYGLEHRLERRSTDRLTMIQATALMAGVGNVGADSVSEEKLRARSNLIIKEVDNELRLTTHHIRQREQEVLDEVMFNRGTYAPVAPNWKPEKGSELSDEQQQAVATLLGSSDFVSTFTGVAGGGKTRSLKTVYDECLKRGKKMIALAPTAAASRGVLQKDGFAGATTLAAFIHNPKLQREAHNQIILLDEAGLCGIEDMHRLIMIAKEQNAQLILSGDTSQHNSVAQGDSLRLIQNYSKTASAKVTTVYRQQNETYKELVTDVREGRIAEGFQKLDALGNIREFSEGREVYSEIAQTYGDLAKRKQSAMIITPTHAESDFVTNELRGKLKANGILSSKEQEVTTLKSTQTTIAQRTNYSSYQAGQIIQFEQNCKGGFKRGQRVTVLEVKNSKVYVQAGQTKRELPLHLAEHFEIYTTRNIQLAAGDRIRITHGGKSKEGKQIRNNDTFTVRRVLISGDIRLTNGWTLPADFGHFRYGYAITSQASQGAKAKHVLIAQTTNSRGAIDNKSLYVSLSRGTHHGIIFTDNKQEIMEQAADARDRPLAYEMNSHQQRPHVPPPPAQQRDFERERELQQ